MTMVAVGVVVVVVVVVVPVLVNLETNRCVFFSCRRVKSLILMAGFVVEVGVEVVS